MGRGEVVRDALKFKVAVKQLVENEELSGKVMWKVNGAWVTPRLPGAENNIR